MDSALRLDRVSVQRDGHRVLDRVSFAVAAGEKVLLMGPSGAGKSSILAVCTGGLRPDAGEVRIAGRLLERGSVDELRRCLSYVGQVPELAAPRVREALELPFLFRANRARKPPSCRIEETLARLRLPVQILDRTTSSLSGGEAQRLAVARAALLDRPIYLLDEITAHLDLESRDAVLAFFREVRVTVLAVAHDSAWQSVCPRLLRIEGGQLHAGV